MKNRWAGISNARKQALPCIEKFPFFSSYLRVLVGFDAGLYIICPRYRGKYGSHDTNKGHRGIVLRGALFRQVVSWEKVVVCPCFPRA